MILLFDMDGTLLDLCDVHRRTFEAALAEHYPNALYDPTELEGLPTKSKLAMLGITGPAADAVNRRKQELTLQAEAPPPPPALLYVLDRFRRYGYKTGCVTNSVRETTLAFLGKGGLLPLLDVVVTNQDVTNPKPDPEGYVRALTALGATAAEAVAFEDHPRGVAAAEAAGIRTIRVTDPADTVRKLHELELQCLPLRR